MTCVHTLLTSGSSITIPSSRIVSASIHSPIVESAGIDAAESTVTVAVLLLFAGFVSGLDELTVAVLETLKPSTHALRSLPRQLSLRSGCRKAVCKSALHA